MSNKQKAQALLAIALAADDYPLIERNAAMVELNELKKAAKVGWAKLIGSQESGSDDPNTWDDIKAIQAGLKALADKGVHPSPHDDFVEETPELDRALALTEAAIPDKPAAKPKPAKREPEVRGRISERIRELLKASDDPYDVIRETVCKEFPHAVTTNRSLASVASELRGKGEKIAPRRKAAKKEG
jgi:hypothetical protein